MQDIQPSQSQKVAVGGICKNQIWSENVCICGTEVMEWSRLTCEERRGNYEIREFKILLKNAKEFKWSALNYV